MPWLKENRSQDKYESIIRLMGSAFHEDYRAFFPSLVYSFKKLRLVTSNKIIIESEHIATLSKSSVGKKLMQAFGTQPVQNYREHYYNVLTGMSLGAYHDGLEQFFRQCEGPEIKTFYLEKLLADIHSILYIPLPKKFENREDEKIAIQVKLALAILFQILVKKQGIVDNSMLSYFDTRGWLCETLQQMQFNGQTEELLMLFDRFSAEDLQYSGKKKPATNSENSHDFQKNETDGDDVIPIPDLVKELQQEFSEVKQGIKSWLLNDQLQKKREEPVEKWLTSEEVCNYMRISKSTLQRRRASGDIKFFKLAGKYRYEEQYIRQLMRSNDSNFSSPPVNQK